MNKTKLILKGILLWFTYIIVLLTVCSIDSIIHKGWEYLFGIIILTIILITICSFIIDEKEYKIVSGYNLYDKIVKSYYED